MPLRFSIPGGAARPVARPNPTSVGPAVDYAEEGRKLLARVNLEPQGAAPRYSPCSAVFRHAGTGAVLYVGSAQVAKDKTALQELGISRIMFCQDADGRMHFDGEAWVEYRKFAIGRWRSELGTQPTAEETLAYFEPHLRWISGELDAGRSVLIHCLAGAHRAGTAGVASLMYLCNLTADEAVPLAQRLRPVIEPIGGYPLLLARLSEALAQRRAAAAQADRAVT